MSHLEEKKGQNIYDEKDINIDKAKPVDIISQIKYDLKNDILYKILEKRNLHNDIFTDTMIKKLEESRLYTTKDVFEILSINMGTVNHWLKTLSNYVAFKKIGTNNKIEPKGLVQLRMIQMLRKDNNQGLGEIKGLVLPEVEDPNDVEESKPLNERVTQMEENFQSLMKENTRLKQIIYAMIDPSSVKEGQLRLNRDIILPMLEDNTSKEKEILEKLDELEKEKESMKENMVSKEDMKKWASINEEQVKKLLEQTKSKDTIGERIKNTFSSIFGQKK